MAQQSIHPSSSSRNPQIVPVIVFVPEDNLAAGQITSLIEVAGRVVHAPVLTTDGIMLIDTGESILELTAAEMAVLSVISAAWNRLPVA